MNTKIKVARAEEILERASMERAISQLNGLPLYRVPANSEMDGLGKSFGKKLKKSLKRKIKTGFILNPKKRIAAHKREIKKSVKVIKQAAPIIVAGVATYVTGGAAAPLMKMAMEKTAANIQKEKLKKFMSANPQAIAELRNQPVEIAAQSPIVQQMAAELTKDVALQHGYNFTSPEANQYVAAVTEDAAKTVSEEAAKPKPKAGAALAVGLPLALMLLG